MPEMAPALLDTLNMLLPQHLPSEQTLTDWLPTVPTIELAGTTHLAMQEAMTHLLSLLPRSGQVIGDSGFPSEDQAHDAYFHIERVQDDHATAFFRTICTARSIFLRDIDELPIHISSEYVESIDRAFADLISCLLGGGINGKPHVTVFQSTGSNGPAMSRWIRGHQLFAALTQGLIFAFNCLGQAIQSGQSGQVERWVDLSVSLLQGSGAAFALTGDFAVQDYTAIIRPSMMPPACQVSLSGLMSFDHRMLSQIMRDMRPALKALHEQDPGRHDRLAEALAMVYDQHIHVCERFVGNKPSILTKGRTERSGPSLIQQFKTLRLKPFEQPARAKRLVTPPVSQS